MEDEEATRLVLEVLFDIRGRVYDIHVALLGEDEDDDGEEEEEADP